jgi:hypothetical protein
MPEQPEPKKQYTDDGERENPEQVLGIGSDPTELPQEPPDRSRDGKPRLNEDGSP